METKKNIYLLLSNHRTTKGIEQQRDIIKRVFKNLGGFELIETNYLIPNQTNILIEESNLDLIRLMRRMKEFYKKTRFIIFVTEYLSKSNYGYQLNTFDLKTKLAHFYIRIFSKIPLTNFMRVNHNQDFFLDKSSKFKKKLRDLIQKSILIPLAFVFDRDGLINLTELARREYCLLKSKDLYDLCISNCNSVNETYKEFFNCKIILLPTYIDVNKTLHARKNKKQNYMSSIFFSGRLTKYRKEVLKNLFKINVISPSGLFLRYFDSIKQLKNNTDQNKIPLFEIYIKQEKNWPYSSPMRTLMTIEEGHIPINFGNFQDHDINSCAIHFDDSIDEYNIYEYISKVDIERAFNNLDELIIKFNESQKMLLENTFLAISSL